VNAFCWALTSALVIASLPQGQVPGLPQAAPRTALVVGQVIDAGTGVPISGVLVEVRMQAAAPPPAPSFSTQTPRVLTGSDGRFVFRRLPKGSFMITAEKPGYLNGAYGRRRPGGDSQTLVLFDSQKIGNLRIYLWRHSAITGTVVDEAGEPVVGIQMRAFLRTTVAGRRRFVAGGAVAWTDDRGIYRIHGLLPGDYLVAAVSTKVSVAAATAEDVRRGGAVPSAITEVGAAIVAGRGSSMHVGDALLTLGGSATGPAPTNDGHAFVYPTTFHPNTASPGRATVITVGSGEERSGIDLQLVPVATRRISGVVVGADNQTAIPVRLMAEDAGDALLEQEIATTVTDRAGAFVFPAVPVGLYSIRVVQGARLLGGRTGTSTVIQTAAGTISSADLMSISLLSDFSVRWASSPLAVGRDDISNLSIALRPGLNLFGRGEFVSTQAKSVPRFSQVSVLIDSIAQTARLAPVAGRFDDAGRFTALGLPGGRYVIHVGSPPAGWALQSITFNGRDVFDTPLDLDNTDGTGMIFTFTDRPTEAIGTVRNGAGTSDPGASVIVFPADSQTWSAMWLSPRRFRRVRVEASGAFKISPLPAGSYFLVAVPDDAIGDWQDPSFLEALSRGAAPVTIAEGESKTLDLRIREPR
jgi:hypothetical protein